MEFNRMGLEGGGILTDKNKCGLELGRFRERVREI